MVGLHLKSCKNGSYDKSQEIFSSIGQYHTGNHRRQICQCHYLPVMSGGDDYEEISAESPKQRAQSCQMLLEVKSSQQDIEAKQIGK